MTIANFGKITPLEMGVLMLSRYHLTRERGRTEMLQSDGPENSVAAMKEGRRLLKKVTDQDFGYSLNAWYDFLLNDEKAASYTRQTTWRGVERAVLAELQDPDRARLEALAEEES